MIRKREWKRRAQEAEAALASQERRIRAMEAEAKVAREALQANVRRIEQAVVVLLGDDRP
jgi:Tfp pilus assembly protein PilX